MNLALANLEKKRMIDVISKLEKKAQVIEDLEEPYKLPPAHRHGSYATHVETLETTHQRDPLR